MVPNVKLLLEEGELLYDPGKYMKLVGKLNYLTVTRPNVAFDVSVVSQFMSSSQISHWNAVIHILRYLKNSPGMGIFYSNQGHTWISGYSDTSHAGCPLSGRSTTGYCIYYGGNLISWKSKKQNVVSLSSVETEYRAIARTACELTWVRRLVQELGDVFTGLMEMYCDNEASMHISKNHIFHERTKHIEVECHYVREKIVGTENEPPSIEPVWVKTTVQVADILTKPFGGPQIESICNKLGMINIYVPTWGVL